MAYITQMDLINLVLNDPARSPMSLPQIITNEIREFEESEQRRLMKLAEEYYANRSDVQRKLNEFRRRSNTKIEHPNDALWKNPLFWVSLAIGAVVVMIASWIRANGGLRASWLTLTDAVQTGAENATLFFYEMQNAALTVGEYMTLTFNTAGAAVLNTLSFMKIEGLKRIGELVGGALTLLDKLPGVDLSGEISSVSTWVDRKVAQTESKIGARDAAVDALSQKYATDRAMRSTGLNQRRSRYEANQLIRDQGIESARKTSSDAGADYLTGANMTADTLDYLDEVGSIRDDVNLSDDSLRLLRDVGEVRIIERSITLTPSVVMNIENVNENADIDRLTGQIVKGLEEELLISATGVHV